MRLLIFIGLLFVLAGFGIVAFFVPVTTETVHATGLIGFSDKNDPNSFPIGLMDPNHNSIPTKMSLQGKVTDFNGVAVDDANLSVKISDLNSCSQQVFFDYVYPSLIQDGLFSVLLGQNELLKLNYNQDYFMCLYVNDELLSGPQVFRGGQGEVHAEQLFDGNSTMPFDFNYVRVNNDLSVDDSIQLGCSNIYWDDVNQALVISVEC